MTMRDHDAHAPPAERVEREAAAWLTKIEAACEERGEPVGLDDYAAEDNAFAAWLDASPAHRIGLLRLRSAWRRADRLSALKSPSVEAPASARGGPRVWHWAAAAAVAVILVPAVMLFDFGFAGRVVYETDIGGHERVRLADGSRLELNSATRVSAKLSDSERVVILDAGEAFFAVEHDETRPFKVVAGDQVVTVLGTKFSVHRRGGGIEVAVTEGRVQIDDADDAQEVLPTVIGAGDIVTAERGAILVASNDMETVARELSWRQGYVVFDRTPLASAASEFNRYNRVELVIADSTIADIRISGRFRSENVDAFARLLSDGFDLKVERDRNKIVISE